MWRAKLVIAYDGRPYRGSQIQPGVPTVQAEVESALREIRAYGGRTAFAGRTDAGVHAAGQVVSCDVDWSRDARRLAHGMNAVLPASIRVLNCERVCSDFHARFDALSREYRYRLASVNVLPPHAAGFIWARPADMDHARAQEAAKLIEGTHGFGAFASAGVSRSKEPDDLRRTVTECSWSTVDGEVLALRDAEMLHELRIRANGFLPQMVRNIMSAIVEVASGNQPLEWIEYLLVSGDRRLLGPPAPPHGLVLWDVVYRAGLDSESV